MKKRAIIEECRNCRFYHEQGVCKRYPPVPAVTPMDQEPPYRIIMIYAAVDKDDWCGEFIS